jgi:hypothetical protein
MEGSDCPFSDASSSDSGFRRGPRPLSGWHEGLVPSGTRGSAAIDHRASGERPGNVDRLSDENFGGARSETGES